MLAISVCLAAVVAVALYLSHSTFVLKTNHVAFVQSLFGGKLKELRRAGVHIIWPFQRLITFNYSLGRGTVVNFQQFPLRNVRVDPSAWQVVSHEGETIEVDLWFSVLVQDTTRFFFNSFDGDVVGTLVDMARQHTVHVCKGLSAEEIKDNLATHLNYSELEELFGVRINVQIDSVQASPAIRAQRAADIQAAAARRAEQQRELAAIEHARNIEAGKAAAELERIRLAAQNKRAEIAAQALVDADEQAREQAQAQHEVRVAALRHEARWSELQAAQKAGLTTEGFLDYQRTDATRATTKIVYMPSNAHPLLAGSLE